MAFLTLLSIAEQIKDPTGAWQFFIFKVFDFVQHYGWRIIVFTICLKLLLSPLDIYQKYIMRKNQRIKERIQPDLDKLQLQYGNNKPLLQQKTMELNKKEGFSYFSTCILSLVPLIIFITLWPGMTSISQYMSMKQYLNFYDSYTAKHELVLDEKGLTREIVDGQEKYVIDESISGGWTAEQMQGYINSVLTEAEEKAQKQVAIDYEEKYKVDFFWIQNIWSPDVPWKKPILEHSAFISVIGKKYETDHTKIGVSDGGELQAIISNEMYNKVTKELRASPDNKVNGWLILPILSVGLSFLSQFLMTRQQKKSGMAPQGGQGASTMKMMMFMMPLLMGFFALQYTSIFTLYIVTNSLLTLLINLGSTWVLKLLDTYNENRAKYIKKSEKDAPQIMRYGRPDPNAKSSEKDNKDNKKKK